MASYSAAESSPSEQRTPKRGQVASAIAYARRNRLLSLGIVFALILAILWIIGYFSTDLKNAAALSVLPNQAPSLAHPLGSDSQGRDILALMVKGTPLTLRIGLIAGAAGVAVGTALAFIAGYYGGAVDYGIRTVVDTFLTVPPLMVLVLIASSLAVGEGLTVDQMALIVASVSWMTPTRTIRSQVLSLKQRPYIEVARLSGMSGIEVIFKEMVPNLLPYLLASFVLSVSAAILASVGLEALGLGPLNSGTLGMTIYWSMFYGSLLQGSWWWWAPPVAVIVWVFICLYLISAGLDEWSNPRLRKRV